MKEGKRQEGMLVGFSADSRRKACSCSAAFKRGLKGVCTEAQRAMPPTATSCKFIVAALPSHLHLQAAEAKHAAAVESLKEGWVGELKRQKEAWAAAEKGRREAWLADKTKQVKELTVKVHQCWKAPTLHASAGIVCGASCTCCLAGLA